MLNNYKWTSLKKWIPLAVLFIALAFALPVLTKKYCSQSSSKSDECIGIVGIYQIPGNIFSAFIGSMTGAVFSFVAFLLIGKIDRDSRPKPSLKGYFYEPAGDGTEPTKEEFLCQSKQFKVHTEDRKIYKIGTAFWVRIKIVNEGDIVAKNCRAYLTKVTSRPLNGNKWENIADFSNSMPLLWAYEDHKSNFIVGSGINLQSGASYFADVLVGYNPKLILDSDSDGSGCQWFFKIKSIPHPDAHRKICEISKKHVEYKFDIEVYADECDKSKISIVMECEANSTCYLYRDGSFVPEIQKLSFLLPTQENIVESSRTTESALSITDDIKREIYAEL